MWRLSKRTGFYDISTESDVKNEIKQNQQLTDKLHKPIVRKLKEEKFLLHLKTIFGVQI